MSSGSSRSSLGIVFAIVAIAIGVGAFLYFRSMDNGADPNNGEAGGGNGVAGGGGENTNGGTAKPLTAEEYAGAYEFANIGLGHLENLALIKAESTFRALRDKVPGERLPLQNLAVTQTMMVVDSSSQLVKERTENKEAYAQGVETARATLAELAKQDEGLAGLLNGLISVKNGEVEQGIDELKTAAEHAKTNPSYWFALYSAHGELKERSDRTPYPLAVTAIEKAYELVPENLHAIGEAIQTQARAKSGRLVDTLTAAKIVIEPLSAAIKSQTRFDIQQAFNRAIDDLKNDGKRGAVIARQIANVLKPDIAKRIDQRKLDKNLLEYVAVQFGPDFDARAIAAGFVVPQDDPIDVKFSLSEVLTDTNGITDIKVADMNMDSVPDVVVVRNGSIEIHGQRVEDGTPTGTWEPIASFTAPEGSSVSQIVLADLDRDFEETSAGRTYRVIHEGEGVPRFDKAVGYVFTDTDLDIVAFGASGVMLIKNERDSAESGFKRTLSVIPIEDEQFQAIANTTALAVTDVEHDGDLDLVVGSVDGLNFWINQSTKKEVRFANGDANIGPTPGGEAVLDIVPIDWNRDIANDLLVVTSGSVGLMENVLHGRFRWQDLGTKQPGGEAAAIGDFNGDAAWDVMTVDGENVTTNLLSPATVEGTTWLSTSSMNAKGNAIRLLDYDNDTYQDAIIVGDTLTLLRGTAGGKFTAVEDIMSVEKGAITGCDVGDIDMDGDLDIVVATETGVVSYSNDGGNKNNWFRLALRPEPNPEQFPANRVSIHGFGSVLELKSGARYQARTVSEPVTHFGMGSDEQADAMRIIWTDGIPQNIVDAPIPKKSLSVLAPQYLGGSCPYLYTWDGSKFVFYSDCLWAAPLGLQQAEGVFAPTREWEYLKIDGSAMQARDGKHVLKITEELWEATYLDEVKLIAVDHPAGTEIYSNEKVGPPNVTEFKVHGVKEARLPVAAKGSNGQDLLPLLKAKDKQYARAFGTRLKQGLTNEHFIELDLGKVNDPDNVTLFMVGWVFPTDTNINIGIGQTSEAPPKPPRIQVVNEDGEWVEAIPSVGFPGGKTKTIAIDLSGAFKSDDYRIRMVTSMELYWDAAFFTDGRQQVEVKQTPLPLLSANLRYRGFSKRKYAGSVFSTDGFGPEGYGYDDVSTKPTWLPMDGRFTKFGDVLPLLTDRDDLQVVFGAGDEVTLEFDAREDELPAGWVRDYLLYNVGWDKDVKQNTVYGSTVEPLPYEGMKSYTDPDSAFPQTPKHANFLKTWQTRTQNLRRFRNWVREFDTSRRKSSE